jgi:hypothetical protein
LSFIEGREDNMKFPPCPHCGKLEEVYVNGQWHGPAPHFFETNGIYCEASTDKLRAKLGKTIRCASCNKIRKDIFLNKSGEIEVK